MRFISYVIEDYYKEIAPMIKKRGELLTKAGSAKGKEKVKIKTEIAKIEKAISKKADGAFGHLVKEAKKKETPSRDTEGEKQTEVVMKQFHKGKLKAYGGEKVTDVQQAKAIAMSEKRAAEKRGRGQREYKGSKRMRPHLKKEKE